MPALVRLGWRWDRAVEVRLRAMRNRVVSNRNCVVATRGGEQRNENDQSVTQTARAGRRCELDSVGVDGRAFERMAKPVERAIGAEPNRRTAGDAPGRHADGWRRNGRKPQRSNQGGPPVLVGATGPQSAYLAGGSQSVRSSGETGNDRGAKGRRKVEVQRTDRRKRKPSRVPVRAVPRWIQPSTIGSDDTERVPDGPGDEAKSRSLSREHPPTGKPDAGDPPVRFGGRGSGAAALPTPIQ